MKLFYTCPILHSATHMAVVANERIEALVKSREAGTARRERFGSALRQLLYTADQVVARQA